MSDGLRPKDLRYVDKVSGPHKQANKRRANLKYRANQRAFRSMNVKKEYERRWEAALTPAQMLDLELRIAKEEIATFIKRTGRRPDFSHTYYHMRRLGLSVMDLIANDLHKPKSWLTLRYTPGHRRMLAQKELRYLCVKLRVRFWKEMRTREQMAALFILAHMDGLTIGEDYE